MRKEFFKKKLSIVFITICWALQFWLAPFSAAEGPTVTKVEPPNWWVGHSINPVRLLVRGSGLQGAALDPGTSGLGVGLVRVNATGTYMFADVWIPPGQKPGPTTLTVSTAGGQITLPFEVSAALTRAGRFQGFSSDDVIYLLMPDRFSDGDPSNDNPAASPGLLDRKKPRYYHGGDFQGVINRLPYLKELGVTALWMNPIYDNANRLNQKETYNGEPITDYHGYGAVDFYGVEEHFGTMAKLRELVDAAHGLGIKVIQDQIANHTGPYHPWVKDSPTPTWYNGTEAAHLANTWQTWTLMDPYASYSVQKATLEGWFINILPDLNQDDEEVSRYLIQNTLWWVGMTGFDGIRQDTLPYVPRRFWRDWTAAIKREFPQLKVVGEMFDGNPALVSFFQGGQARFDKVDSGIDALFDFPLFYPIRRAFAEEKSLRELAILLGHDWLYPDPENLVTFLGLHDVPRFMNETGAGWDGLELAFAFLMTTRGIPMIYYGDEIGLPGGADPDNRRDFPGGWPGDPQNAFLPSGRSTAQQALWDRIHHLIALRKELKPLRCGKTMNLYVGEQTWAFARLTGNEAVVVVFNNSRSPEKVEFNSLQANLEDGTEFEDRLGGMRLVKMGGGKMQLSMPARSAAILTTKK